MEAAFTSQLITLFIYDAPLPIATRIFEMFLVEGEQVILDFIAGLIEMQYAKIIMMEETELMEFFRRDILIETFKSKSFT